MDSATAQAHLAVWLAADLAVSNMQTYSYGNRTLSSADSAEIRTNIQYWEGRLAALRHREAGVKSPRATLPGFCHWPMIDAFDEKYFDQLTAETRVTKHRANHAYYVWEKRRARNEALDVRILAHVALRILREHFRAMLRTVIHRRPLHGLRDRSSPP